MKHILYRATLLTTFLLLTNTIKLSAQQYKALPQSIFEVLVGQGENGGEVEIKQTHKLMSLVGRVSPKYGRILVGESNARVVYGYRIIFFNSNAPKAKSIAYARQEELRQIVPEQATYIHFNAPFWKLQLGDFTTKEEAKSTLKQLQKVLPYWKKEAYIIRDRIRLIK